MSRSRRKFRRKVIRALFVSVVLGGRTKRLSRRLKRAMQKEIRRILKKRFDSRKVKTLSVDEVKDAIGVELLQQLVKNGNIQLRKAPLPKINPFIDVRITKSEEPI